MTCSAAALWSAEWWKIAERYCVPTSLPWRSSVVGSWITKNTPRISIDSKRGAFKEILEVFFVIHDPTTLDRQGNDVGTQYRSAIFHHSAEQKAAAEQVIENLGSAKIYDDPIVTEVVPASEFYVADDYHQEYFRLNPAQPYCAFVVRPKVAKFRKHFLEKLKK